MGSETVPRPFRLPEGRTLKGPVPAAFEAFYRSELRPWTGARISSGELRRRYLRWAGGCGAPALSFREIKRAMTNVGHEARTSNGVYYCDVLFVEDALGQPESFPEPAVIAPPEAERLLRWVDRLAVEISAIRPIVANLSGAPGAHRA